VGTDAVAAVTTGVEVAFVAAVKEAKPKAPMDTPMTSDLLRWRRPRPTACCDFIKTPFP
jgi:hypothetical protein